MTFSTTHWFGFIVFLTAAIIADVGFFNRKPRALSFKESATMTLIWFLAASIFCSIIYFNSNRQTALEFITGYIVELSLSMDNVFVFILIFSYFKVPSRFQHRVLFWGIIGAIIMRFLMIIGGIYLFRAFEPVFYIFGAFLIYSGLKIATTKEDNAIDLKGNKVIKFLNRHLNITTKFHDENFFIKRNGKHYCTPLFLALVLIEQVDLLFALDSIPAILAITQNSFVVFTSNIFAILGLRSLYFLLAGLVDRFEYLKFGIGIILSFVGVKMIVAMHDIHIPVGVSLLIILTILLSSMVISFKLSKKKSK